MSVRALHAVATLAFACAVVALPACRSAPPPKAPPAPPPSVSTGTKPTPGPPTDVASIPDAVPRAEPRSLRGNPPFYEVFGQRYYVLATADGYVQRGVASWYGPGFHAERTSMGEPYDMYAMTAAHKTLPLPCYARVTNLANGRSVVVRINDRGPFVGDRIIDLSYTAASKLDMLRAGTAMVEVAVITPGSAASVAPTPLDPRPLEPVPAGAMFVQAGAFSDRANAQRLVDRLQGAGIDDATVRETQRNGQSLYRVRVGPVADVAAYDALIARLASLGVTGAHLATD